MDVCSRLLLAAIFLSLLAGGLTWRLLWRQLAPLVSAAELLDAIPPGERPLQPLPIAADNEIGTLIGGFNRVLAALGEREQALRESEQRLKTIIETEPECVKVVGPSGELQEMNAAGLAMLEAGSISEVKSHSLLKFILPEYRAAFISLHKRVMNGEGGVLEFEVVGLRGTRRWLSTHAAPMRDTEGRVTGLLGITQDITERKLAEAQRATLEAQLRESQKMEALGTLAGGIAHDFNNALAAITGNTELARQDVGPGHIALESLE